MLHKVSPIPDGSRNPPRRRDSLGPKASLLFAAVDEELHDIRRVHMQGQEEDLRYALGRLITRVEELVRISSEMCSSSHMSHIIPNQPFPFLMTLCMYASTPSVQPNWTTMHTYMLEYRARS